eukprot:3685351-Amphidinium_carterae.1
MFVHTSSAAADSLMCSLWRPGALELRPLCCAALGCCWRQHYRTLALSHHAILYCRNTTADRNSAGR